jgi:signal transduction histidine kinase
VSANESTREQLHLDVHPSVVFRLGDELITNDVQALVELVKNAYDADSSTASIEIRTDVWTDPLTGAEVPEPEPEPAPGHETELDPATQELEGGRPDTDGDSAEDAHRRAEVDDRDRPVQGIITIRDRGTGMTHADLVRGWLTVSASDKRAMKKAGRTTAKDRTPLGDKGLGRLGAQRLGHILDVETTPEHEEVTYSLSIPWRDYESANALNDVALTLSTRPRGTQRAGTRLTIRGLRNIEHWHGGGLADLERELSVMISPYGDRGFEVALKGDSGPIDLHRRPIGIRESSLLRYELDYADGVLNVRGQIGTEYFRPAAEKDQPEFHVLMEQDKGAGLRDRLLAKLGGDGGVSASSEDRYFIDVSTRISLESLVGVRVDPATERPVDPGPFKGEIDSVPLREKPTDVFNTVAEYRSYVRRINGVRVYRDGFGIRVDRDWLGLGSQWTGATSYYTLRPENVVGYVDLTAKGNPALIETTNREGFQDTPAFRNFMLLMEAWRGYTERIQGAIRREYVAHRKDRAVEATDGAPMTPDAISARAEDRLRRVQQSVTQSKRVEADVRETLRQISSASAADSLFRQTPAVDDAVARGQRALDAAAQLSTALEIVQANCDAAVGELQVLQAQVETVQEQLASAWEAVSIGITAEALSHEVHQIADRLRARSQQVSRHLESIRSRDTTVAAFVEHVRSAAAALNRQLMHLNPALRYMRERRTTLTMSTVTADVAEYFTERWADRPLSIEREVIRDFTVTMNGGKLTQVFDNLVLNSEFWLLEQQRAGRADHGKVFIRVDAPCITVSDTGPGIDPSVEAMLFEPFVTTKGRGVGRGLGLFVTRQLLDTEGASIELDPDRGPDGRRRTFRITFGPTRDSR